jgi:hypothetical protein
MAAEKVCTFVIKDYQNDDDLDYNGLLGTSNEKALRSVFLKGPSPSVISKGAITVKEIRSNGGQPEPEPDNPPEPQQESYSIRNAYLNYVRLFEADGEDDTDDQGGSDDSDGDQEESDDQPSSVEFKPLRGSTINVKVALEDYGYSIWTLKPHEGLSDSLDSIINKLKSGKFKEAYNDANKATKSVGFIPIEVETFMNKPGDGNIIPFIGRCRFAIDSGDVPDSSNTTSDEDQLPDTTVTFAMAPLDGNNQNKPSEDMVYKVDFMVKDADAFTDNKLSTVLQKIKALTNNDDQRDETQSELSKYLNSMFKPGDSSKFEEFLKIENYIKEHLSGSNSSLERTSNADNWTEFVNKCKSGDRLLCF